MAGEHSLFSFSDRPLKRTVDQNALRIGSVKLISRTKMNALQVSLYGLLDWAFHQPREAVSALRLLQAQLIFACRSCILCSNCRAEGIQRVKCF